LELHPKYEENAVEQVMDKVVAALGVQTSRS
jgi:hypothetical protein